MIKLSDLINAAANQKEWKPLDRKEKEKPIVLPTSTSYVNFLDKENNRTVIKKEDHHKLIPKFRKIAQGLVVHEPRQILELEGIKRDEEN